MVIGTGCAGITQWPKSRVSIKGARAMSYMRYREKFGDVLIDLDGIRFIKEVGSNPAGGHPRGESGEIIYSDGFVLPVSRGCAQAVQDAFKSRTVPQNTKSR